METAFYGPVIVLLHHAESDRIMAIPLSGAGRTRSELMAICDRVIRGFNAFDVVNDSRF